MGLPDDDTAWPPAPYDKAAKQMQVWDAWYSSDTDRLQGIYTNLPTFRPSQVQGGLVGAVARFFWGRPNLQTTKRMHVPIAADIARGSADLLFSQPPRFVLAEDDASGSTEVAQKRLDQLLGGPETVSALAEAGETASALGGVYLRLWWDEEVDDQVCLHSVAADSALPEWRYGRLSGVTFWTVVFEDDKSGEVWRHLEYHGPGRIEHALFQGDRDRLGMRVPLGEHKSTEWAADLVDKDSAIPTGVRGLTAAYVPNVRPNRLWRNTAGLAALGRSDFDGLEPLFDALDETYSAWMRDVEHAKSRLFVDKSMTENRGPGAGSMFDIDQAIFTPLPGMALGKLADGSPPIIPQQFDIRWQEYHETCLELINAILRGAGQSASTFGDDRLVGALTATEVNSRDRLSERTRDKKIGYWKAALGPLAKTMVDLDAAVFSTGISLKEDPEVHFPVRTQQSPVDVSTSLAALKAAHLVSTEQGVRERNPNWSKEDVEEEVTRIKGDAESEAAIMYPPQPNPQDQQQKF